MVELVEEGKVRWIGVANFDTVDLDRCDAICHVDSSNPLFAPCARLPTYGCLVGGRARNRRDRLLADGLRVAGGRLRP